MFYKLMFSGALQSAPVQTKAVSRSAVRTIPYKLTNQQGFSAEQGIVLFVFTISAEQVSRAFMQNKAERPCPDQARLPLSGARHPFFFFVTLVTVPRWSLSLKLSDTRVYEPQMLSGGSTNTVQTKPVSRSAVRAIPSSSLLLSSLELSATQVYEPWIRERHPIQIGILLKN